MTEATGLLTDLQVTVARLFFTLDEAADFLVVGGAALVALGLVARPTLDIDLFASAPTTSVSDASRALIAALRSQGHAVVVIQEARTFCRVVVSGPSGDETLVDLAVDSPPRGPVSRTVLGPTYPPLELAGRKLLALFGRAEARDFADVFVLADRFGAGMLIEEARALDAGFDVVVLAQMLATIARFDDAEIPLSGDACSRARTFFSEWGAELRQGEA